jgi:hypothetical protein
LCGLTAAASAFYLPGMTPVTFKPDDRVKIRVNKLTSTKTQRTCVPLFFCQPCTVSDGRMVRYIGAGLISAIALRTHKN